MRDGHAYHQHCAMHMIMWLNGSAAMAVAAASSAIGGDLASCSCGGGGGGLGRRLRRLRLRRPRLRLPRRAATGVVCDVSWTVSLHRAAAHAPRWHLRVSSEGCRWCSVSSLPARLGHQVERRLGHLEPRGSRPSGGASSALPAVRALGGDELRGSSCARGEGRGELLRGRAAQRGIAQVVAQRRGTRAWQPDGSA